MASVISLSFLVEALSDTSSPKSPGSAPFPSAFSQESETIKSGFYLKTLLDICHEFYAEYGRLQKPTDVHPVYCGSGRIVPAKLRKSQQVLPAATTRSLLPASKSDSVAPSRISVAESITSNLTTMSHDHKPHMISSLKADGSCGPVDAYDTPQAEEAAALAAQANRAIEAEGGLKGCNDWGGVRDSYFHAAALYQSVDLHREAAECFNNAAAICRIFGGKAEVANVVGHAVDSYRRLDPMQAIGLLKELYEIHGGAGRTKLQAKAALEAAELYEAVAVPSADSISPRCTAATPQYNLERALEWYKKAHTLYQASGGEMTRNFYTRCLKRMAYITSSFNVGGGFLQAIKHFETLARDVTKGSRGFSVQYHYQATLCWLSMTEGDDYYNGIQKAKKMFYEYQINEAHFQEGVEYRHITAIIDSMEKGGGSLADFDAAEQEFRRLRSGLDGPLTTDPAFTTWFKGRMMHIRGNIYQYIAPHL